MWCVSFKNAHANKAKYGEIDRREGTYAGYYGYHLTIALRACRDNTYNQELTKNTLTTISIDRGTNVYRDFLSVTEGSKVHLFSKKAPLQKWNLALVEKDGSDVYTIQVADSSSGATFYLSCLPNSSSVALASADDGSGSQHWCFREVGPGTYNILNKGPNKDTKSIAHYPDNKQHAFLSCTYEGFVDLYSHDDESGRQQWIFEAPLKLARTSEIPTILQAEIQFHPEQLFSSRPGCVHQSTHDAYERLYYTLSKDKDLEKTEEVQIEKAKLRKAIEIHYAVGLSRVK